MIIGDVVKWLMVYVFLWIAFSVATHVVILGAYAHDPHAEHFASNGPPAPFQTYIISYFYVVLGEVSGWEDYGDPYTLLVMTLHIVYILMSTLLMFNLIIAMVSNFEFSAAVPMSDNYFLLVTVSDLSCCMCRWETRGPRTGHRGG